MKNFIKKQPPPDKLFENSLHLLRICSIKNTGIYKRAIPMIPINMMQMHIHQFEVNAPTLNIYYIDVDPDGHSNLRIK